MSDERYSRVLHFFNFLHQKNSILHFQPSCDGCDSWVICIARGALHSGVCHWFLLVLRGQNIHKIVVLTEGETNTKQRSIYGTRVTVFEKLLTPEYNQHRNEMAVTRVLFFENASTLIMGGRRRWCLNRNGQKTTPESPVDLVEKITRERDREKN